MASGLSSAVIIQGPGQSRSLFLLCSFYVSFLIFAGFLLLPFSYLRFLSSLSFFPQIHPFSKYFFRVCRVLSILGEWDPSVRVKILTFTFWQTREKKHNN